MACPSEEHCCENLGHSSLTNAVISADFEADGNIDVMDLAILRQYYGHLVTPYTGADANGDGVLLTIQTWCGGKLSSQPGGAVP